MKKRPIYDFQSFEAALIDAAETFTEVYRIVAELCYEAVEYSVERYAAELLCRSTNWVRRMARVFQIFGPTILPGVPLHIYEVAARSDDPFGWAEKAIKNEWSARQLSDAIGLQRGVSISSVPLLPPGVEADVLCWDDDGIITLRLEIENWQPSGRPPNRVRLERVTEVLVTSFPAEDPSGLRVFDCPDCSTANAVIEKDVGFRCRACGAIFGESEFDDWRDDLPDDMDEP